MHRTKYIVTPIFNYYDFNKNHLYETEEFKVSTDIFFVDTTNVNEKYNVVRDYFNINEPGRDDISDKIINHIENCFDYVSTVPDGYVISKFEYFNQQDFNGEEIFFHDYLIDAMILKGIKLKFSRSYNITEYKRYGENFIFLDLTGQRVKHKVNEFNNNFKAMDKYSTPSIEEISKVFQHLIWIRDSETVQNTSTNHLNLSLDYYFNSFTVHEKKIAYINLVMIIEMLFKWSKDETGSEITTHLTEFITHSPHYRSRIRKDFNSTGKIFDMRNSIVHGDILSNQEIEINYIKLFKYVNETVLILLEKLYLVKDDADSIDTNSKFQTLLKT